MNVYSIIFEQIDWIGRSKSFKINSNDRHGLCISFPTEYEGKINEPFNFHSPEEKNEFREKHRTKQSLPLNAQRFFQNNDIFSFVGNGQGLNPREGYVSMCVLYLPPFAVPININIEETSGRINNQLKRNVLKMGNRYLIYWLCEYLRGSIDYKIHCQFINNHNLFLSNSYHDDYVHEFYDLQNVTYHDVISGFQNTQQIINGTNITVNNGQNRITNTNNSNTITNNGNQNIIFGENNSIEKVQNTNNDFDRFSKGNEDNSEDIKEDSNTNKYLKRNRSDKKIMWITILSSVILSVLLIFWLNFKSNNFKWSIFSIIIFFIFLIIGMIDLFNLKKIKNIKESILFQIINTVILKIFN